MKKRPPSETPVELTEAEREAAAWLAQSMTSVRFLVNKAVYPDGAVDISEEMLIRIPARFTGPPIVLVTSIEAIEQSPVVLAKRQCEDFANGVPVMVLPDRLDILPKREHGGQKMREIERRARDGFYVVVALTTEQIRACLEAANRVKYTTAQGREHARNELPRKLPILPGNAFNEGQALLSKWCPRLTAHEILKNTYCSVRQELTRNEYLRYIDLQKKKVSIAATVYDRTLKALAAQYGMSDLHRGGTPISEDQLKDIVNSHDEYVPVDDLMLAAIQMDLNPSYAFRNHSHFEIEFECGMLVGRLLRGVTVTMTPEHMSILRRLFELTEGLDADPSSTSEELRAAVLVRDHALNCDGMTRWQRLFRHVQALDQPIMLNPPRIT